MQAKYTYDNLNQLIREDNKERGVTIVYTYDANGNMTRREEYDFNTGTLSGNPKWIDDYNYDSTWKDQLNNFNGTSITYDAIGNPLRYRDNMIFSWKNGRQAAGITTIDRSLSFGYDRNGNRIRKTVKLLGFNTLVEHTYDYDGEKLLRENYGNTQLWFMYDESGLPVGLRHYTSSTYDDVYYYIRNLQGDIVAIAGEAGNIEVRYTYDAWGNILSITDDYGNDLSNKPNHIANINPLRYRGYYYDTETGLYYLQSRFYDPVTCRFVNADGVMGTNDVMNTYNLFVYCGNNPITRYDTSGASWKNIIRGLLHLGNNFAVSIGIDTAAIGGFLLCMDKDENGIYSARFDCWQQHFGYNDFYDYVFDAGTSCEPAKLDFVYNNKQYIFWAWKGDYINLGAGAEMGIYHGGNPHWSVDMSLAMPMYFFLSYKGSTIISHGATTWWVTGFNPAYLNVNEKDLTVTFGVHFTDRGMFDAFYEEWHGKPGFQFYPYGGNGFFFFTF